MVRDNERAKVLKEIFAKNLNHYIDKDPLNQTDIARKLGIPEMTMSNWVNARTYPRTDKIQLLADYFNINRYNLTEELRTPSNMQAVSSRDAYVPILGEISCGDPIMVAENFAGYRTESQDNLPGGNLFYLEAKGDSMEPIIPHGSLVLIREQSQVEYGEIAAVLLNSDTEATLKKITKQGDTVLLMPINRAYDPIVLSEENPARIIGKAIRYTRDL